MFLGRLKDQHDLARKAPRLGQVLGSPPQQHRCMAVMAAGMHAPFDGGGIVQPGFLGHRQGIHIGAQSDGATVTSAIDHRHNAGDTDLFMDLIDAEFLQALDHIGGSLMALQPPQLRMHMHPVPPGLHLFSVIGNAVDDRHGLLLCARMISR